MPPDLLLVLLTVPTLLAVIKWRVPAAAIFFSLLIGQLLATEVGSEVQDLVTKLANNIDVSNIRLGLIIMPPILSVVLLRKRVPKSSLIIQIVPALLTAIVLVAILVNENSYVYDTLQNSHVWSFTEPFQPWILLVAGVTNLVLLWLSYPKVESKKEK